MVNHSKLVLAATVKLADLLDEAIERATVLINEKNTNLSDDEKTAVIEAVGIGSVNMRIFLKPHD